MHSVFVFFYSSYFSFHRFAVLLEVFSDKIQNNLCSKMSLFPKNSLLTFGQCARSYNLAPLRGWCSRLTLSDDGIRN